MNIAIFREEEKLAIAGFCAGTVSTAKLIWKTLEEGKLGKTENHI